VPPLLPWRDFACELWAARFEIAVIVIMAAGVLLYIWIGVS
jgi:hypothetical protein